MAVKRFNRWRKSGVLQKFVHRAADLHAEANRGITKAGGAPRTQAELARAMRELADEMREYVRDATLRAAMSNNPSAVRNLDELKYQLGAIEREFLEVLRDTAAEAVRASYGGGKASTLFQLGEPVADSFVVSFSRPDRAAMAALANDLFNDLAGQTHQMTRSAVSVLRTTAGEVLQHQLALGSNVVDAARALGVELTKQGYSESEAMRELRDAMARSPLNGAQRPVPGSLREAATMLADDGALKFVDKAGRTWDLRDYCEMAAKTKLFIARNEAAVTTMNDAGVNHWRANTTAFECDFCDKYEGEVWWTGDGDSRGYARCPLDLPPWHPNCEHYVIPEVLVGR